MALLGHGPVGRPIVGSRNRRDAGFKMVSIQLLQSNGGLRGFFRAGFTTTARPVLAVAYGLRCVDAAQVFFSGNAALALGVSGRCKAVYPANLVPVTDVKGLHHSPSAGRCTFGSGRSFVGRWAGATSFRRVQIHRRGDSGARGY